MITSGIAAGSRAPGVFACSRHSSKARQSGVPRSGTPSRTPLFSGYFGIRHAGSEGGRGFAGVRANPPSGASPQFFGESSEEAKRGGMPKIDLSKMDISKVDLSKIPKVQLDDQQKEALQEVLDTSNFGKRGEGWVVGSLITIGLLIFPPMGIEVFVKALGFGLTAVGGFLWFLGLTNLGIGNLSPFATPRKNNRLTTGGVYKYVRHPMYGGYILFAFGLAIATGDAARFALSTLLLFMIEQKVKLEEASLKMVHPEFYEEYMTNKPKPQKYIPIFY